MADGDNVLTSTAQFGIDVDGNRVLFATGEDCPCCEATENGVCGECIDDIGDTVTIDLGTTAFTSAISGYYSDCTTPCDDFSGEIVLNIVPLPELCVWNKLYSPFCTRNNQNDGSGTSVNIDATIYAFIKLKSGVWVWVVNVQFIGFLSPTDGYVQNRFISYEVATTTVCTGKTYTLAKIEDYTVDDWHDPDFAEFHPRPVLPCKSSADPDVWDFPATIDLIIP